ncbi:MAG: NifB/NifX family molybdenum-iron cluster-binding protein [Chromatiaceae bacterium]|jgi:nitrogen fixation protein NifX|nr:NifB/NifX family molybdenum-iron cluster-binding protein [Chromatiaceae bacterium]
MPLERRLKLVTTDEAGPEVVSVVKVAFATSDMKRVDQHFGAAESFAVYVLNSRRISLAEAVQFSPSVTDGYEEGGRRQRSGGDRKAVPGLGASGHDENKLAARIDALDGCVAVYCRAVGASAIDQLRGKGIQAVKIASDAEIKDLLEALQQDLRTGTGGYLARALARSEPSDARRFDAMEQEGWIE